MAIAHLPADLENLSCEPVLATRDEIKCWVPYEPIPGEDVVKCAHCGIYLPRERAYTSPGNQLFHSTSAFHDWTED